MTDFLIRAGQLAIAAAVMFAAIWFQETYDYPINPTIIAIWSFLASYGATWGLILLLERRVRYGRILPRLSREKHADQGVEIDLSTADFRRDARRDRSL